MELSLGGDQLVDDTGASYSLFFSFTPGDRLFPGGHWVKVDATHVRSIGGLVHEFYDTGKLKAIYWQSADYPRLAYRTSQPFGGGAPGDGTFVGQFAEVDCEETCAARPAPCCWLGDG